MTQADETRPPADTPIPADGQPAPSPADLRSQARQLRRALSTADIIMVEDHDTRFSRKTYIYLAGAMGSLVLILALILIPATRTTLADRTDRIAQIVTSANPATDQAALDANEQSPAATASDEGEPILPSGFTIGSGAPQSAAAAPPPPSAAPQVLRAPNRPAPPAAVASAPPAATAARPAAKPPAVPAARQSDAYRLLLAQRPAFAELVNGTSDEYRYVEHTTTARDTATHVLDFTFQKGRTGEPVHFIWEVNLATQAVKPIGLAAARFDRRQPR
ncbi:MAG: hypothetical protein GX414_12530 [Acidobacteria bacterium]|nr:hypothetical protein [Acidobacteriota bacterium]